MGLVNCLQDWCAMMARTKPQYLSVLGRKRSSVSSPQKLLQNEGKTCHDTLRSFVCVVAMCCSVLYGVGLLVISESSVLTASNLLVPLIVAGVAAITGGLCLSEYINSQSQEVPSIYSCCYQYSSEVLAFFIGWTWLLSQAALVASICKAAAILVDQWTNNAILKMFESSIFPVADSVPSLAFLLVFVLFVVTGLSETLVWYVAFVPMAFVLTVASLAIIRTEKNEDVRSADVNWLQVQSVDQVLTAATLCLLFFSGPHSILRISEKKVRQKTTAVLGPLNAISFVVILILLFMAFQSGSLFQKKPTFDSSPAALSRNILHLICFCILGVESFYPLHFVIEDMATDGLLFRTLSKKRTPFCFPVASAAVQVLCVIGVGLLVTFLPLMELLVLSVMFPLVVNSLVPFLVLIQRYRDNSAWQYEPMFHTTARTLRNNGSRKKVQEHQYSNGGEAGYKTIAEDLSTTCIDENSSEDDTDIDSVVQQYKDQARIANMAILEEHDPSKQTPEPTPASSFRAKLGIVALFMAAFINGLTMNFADEDRHFSLAVVSLLCLLFSVVILGLLLCMPQNGRPSSVLCTKIHPMPWIPGVACLMNTCLFVHCMLEMWKVFLGWLLFGFLIYLCYGIRSSTAANSFYNLQPAHINLCPLPNYGNNCIPQVVPSQRKKIKSLQKNGRKKVFVT